MGTISRAEAIKIAENVLDRKTKSFVGSAIELSQFLLAEEREKESGKADGHRQLADNLTTAQARATELVYQMRELKNLIEKISVAAEGRGEPKLIAAINEAVSAARATQ
jgi:hypothetical protein